MRFFPIRPKPDSLRQILQRNDERRPVGAFKFHGKQAGQADCPDSLGIQIADYAVDNIFYVANAFIELSRGQAAHGRADSVTVDPADKDHETLHPRQNSKDTIAIAG